MPFINYQEMHLKNKKYIHMQHEKKKSNETKDS